MSEAADASRVVSARQTEGVAGSEERERYVETVLRIVEAIPPGQATTYGLIAAAVGRGGPRGVGRVMATYGGPVPWWRVVRADGRLPTCHQRSALSHYREEDTPLRGSIADAATLRIDLEQALWTPAANDAEALAERDAG